jgi:hypothetical protein
MATTLNVMNSVVFASTLIKNQRLNVNGQEPGLTMANIVLQRMLAPPAVWRFNRANLAVPITTAGGADYVVSVPLLGRIEQQWLTDASGNITELKGAVSLAKVSSKRAPKRVAPQYDDNAGNITFRFDTIPDQNYTANFDYQQKATLITSWSNPWGPVADEFGFIFNKGFLALAALLVNDARFPIWEKDFVAGFLGAQDGLDEQARAIFLGQWFGDQRSAQRSQAAGQAGAAGRAQ